MAIHTAPAGEGGALRKTAALGNIGRIRRFIAPAVARPYAVLESAVFMVIVLAATTAVHPHDPLLLHADFPWIWFATGILALRYGTLVGLFGCIFLLVDWVVAYKSGGAPVGYFAGGLIQTIMLGHFGDTWGARAAQANAKNDYLHERLVALTNNHYLLRLSHDRLEKDLLSQPTTLRDSIVELRRLSVQHGVQHADERLQAELSGAITGEQTAVTQLLRYAAQVCRLEQAAFYTVQDGKLAKQPLAITGEPFPLVEDDTLLFHALDAGTLAHLKSEDGEMPDSVYLACAPLVTADGTIKAMLIVKRMPFLSLTFDNLQLLQVLLGYFGDGFEHADMVRHVQDIAPHCPVEFALELGRLGRMAARTGVYSSVVALSFPRDQVSDSLFEHVSRRRRALDVFWEIRTATQSVVLNLMPVTDSAGVDGYLTRIDSTLRAQFGTDLEQAHVAVHTQILGEVDPALALENILSLCGLDG